jgi:hypothetical protein
MMRCREDPVEIVPTRFVAAQIWEHATILGNKMGTISFSTGVYRAFWSDQGRVNLAIMFRLKNGGISTLPVC